MAKVETEIDTDNIYKKKVQSGGKVYVGKDLAGKTIEYAILEVEEPEE